MKEKQNSRHILLFPMVVMGLFVIFLSPVYAQESCEEIYHCSDFEGDAKDRCKKDEKECKKLEEKAEAYQKIVELKKKQKSTLGSQINNLRGEIQQTQEEIEENKERIGSLNGEVQELNRKIEQKKELLEAQKELLSEIIRVYYENRQEDALSLMFKSGGFAAYMSQGDFLTQTGAKIQDTLREIKNIQKKLEEEIKKN